MHFADQSGPMPQQVRQQEQMFDHFQQVMTMIVQRFGDNHRDQMQVVREEITQIRQLSGELQSLHSRLSTPPPTLPPSTRTPRPRHPPRIVAGPPPIDRERPVGSGACTFATGRRTPSRPGREDRSRTEPRPCRPRICTGSFAAGWRPWNGNRGVTGRGSSN